MAKPELNNDMPFTATNYKLLLIGLAIVAVGVARGKFSGEDVETSGLYWHFVDLVWMFIFPLVYLMSAKL